MAIDRQTVDHVARLARLDLSEAERERMQAEISQILEHVARIQAFELDELAPTSHVVPVSNVFRRDEVRPCLSQEEALANAPATEDGRFKVPRIIEDA